jgi:hypothetical protein
MKNLLFFIFFLSYSNLYAQDFGGDKVGMINFIKRMYTNNPFDGVKIMQNDDGNKYMICVVSLKNDPNKSENTFFIIADAKARAKASQNLNGTSSSIEFIVISKEQKPSSIALSSTETTEILKESSSGYINGIELLTNFVSSTKSERVFIYYKEIK